MFSFLSNQRYEVKYIEVKNNDIIIEFLNKQYQVELFNVKLNKQASSYMQEILNNSQEVKIELDDEIKQEDKLIAYVFVDDTLLQQLLIDEGYAKLKINNPNYHYFNQERKVINYQVKKKPILKQDYHGSIYLMGFYLMTIISLKSFNKARK